MKQASVTTAVAPAGKTIEAHNNSTNNGRKLVSALVSYDVRKALHLKIF